MLFDDEDISGRRLLGSKKRRRRTRKPRLKLNARVGGQKHSPVTKVAVFVLAPVVLAVFVALLWLGVVLAGRALFTGNDRFIIHELDVTPGRVITESLIREYTGLHEGMNLFEPDISEIRMKFLHHTPVVKSMTISRHLPDTLRVEIRERQPVARLGPRGHLVVDGEGWVFGLGARNQSLPIIIGYDTRSLKPGSHLAGLALDAVRVLDVIRRTGMDSEIAVTDIDVSGGFSGREDSLRIYLASYTTVDFWWQRDKRGNGSSLSDLHERLMFLRGILRRAEQEGQIVRSVKLTLEDYQKKTTVTYR